MCTKALFVVPQRPFCRALPVRVSTDAEISSSRPICLLAESPAPPVRARDVTSRDVSRRNVAAVGDVSPPPPRRPAGHGNAEFMNESSQFRIQNDRFGLNSA